MGVPSEDDIELNWWQRLQDVNLVLLTMTKSHLSAKSVLTSALSAWEAIAESFITLAQGFDSQATPPDVLLILLSISR